MESLQQRLGIRVKQLRTEMGLSQERLAELANLDRTYIADIEAGKRNVSITVVEKLAEALSLSISELFHEF
ncbi:MAG TPA: transcriptional regulator [Flavobacteriales bacterium]|nr:transcriptional regulator [Flavobacteriales bacterium]